MLSYTKPLFDAKTEFMTLHKGIANNKLFNKFQTCIDVVALKWISKLSVFLFTVLPQLLLASLVILPLVIFKFIFVNIRLYIKSKGKYPLLSDYNFSMDEDDDTDDAYAETTNPYLLKCLRFIDGHIDYEYVRFYSLFDAFECFCETINEHFDDGRNT